MAEVRQPAAAVLATCGRIPGKKLLFMGSDSANGRNGIATTELQWDLLQWDTHQGIQKLWRDLNRLYRSEPALHQVDFD